MILYLFNKLNNSILQALEEAHKLHVVHKIHVEEEEDHKIHVEEEVQKIHVEVEEDHKTFFIIF